MQPCYYIIESQTSAKLPASIREATAADFERTAREHWQTDWRTDFIQDALLEKYALELDTTKELVGLAAYRDMPEGVLVYVEYMESAPSGNPTLSKPRKYAGIGAALLAFGIQLSIDYGYGGHFHRSCKKHASGARCVGKSLCGQGTLPARILRLRPPRPSPGAG